MPIVALNQGRGENAGNGVGTQTAAALAGGSGLPGVFANHEQATNGSSLDSDRWFRS